MVEEKLTFDYTWLLIPNIYVVLRRFGNYCIKVDFTILTDLLSII